MLFHILVVFLVIDGTLVMLYKQVALFNFFIFVFLSSIRTCLILNYSSIDLAIILHKSNELFATLDSFKIVILVLILTPILIWIYWRLLFDFLLFTKHHLIEFYHKTFHHFLSNHCVETYAQVYYEPWYTRTNRSYSNLNKFNVVFPHNILDSLHKKYLFLAWQRLLSNWNMFVNSTIYVQLLVNCSVLLRKILKNLIVHDELIIIVKRVQKFLL